MSWTVTEKGYDPENTVGFGNKFLTGNGYMGFRGTLEEFTKDDLVCCNLLGLYDKVGDSWREPVNAPNGIYTAVTFNGKAANVKAAAPLSHEQTLDFSKGLHGRNTVFDCGGAKVTVCAERFVSMADVHLICMKYTVAADSDGELVLTTGIDGDVWDINGPHFVERSPRTAGSVIAVDCVTGELGARVTTAERCVYDFAADEAAEPDGGSIMRRISVAAKAGQSYTIYKFVSVYTENDGVSDVGAEAVSAVERAADTGYDGCFAAHAAKWAALWEKSDVVIEGDDEAQFSLRYSIYHLHIIAPRHSDRASIPARGLSGQTYKGAIFWDTEMFMLPFFLHTDCETAMNLIKYRIHTLDGARKKAAEYGFEGAFYAWESQETGNDACSDYNVTDVFTNRPMRTYFRDKQVHISGDVAYGIWQTYLFTGDDSLLLDGGAEVILECARFFRSYAYFKADKDRYEILDVIGPDEYHERVNNNAYTNRMVKYTFDAAVGTIELLREKYPKQYAELMAKLNFEPELEMINSIAEKLYVPAPDPETGIIEQFDGYFKLEDCTVDEVRSRLLDDKEYWGGAYGVASHTKVIKQADVVLMLNLFRDEYDAEIKRKNWEYYEPRTEHGSSLSPCVYGLLACEVGNPDWGYPYFMKTASVDLTGKSKSYAGTIYIGGTHPAASGGAWMAAVQGFGGLHVRGDEVTVTPRLPSGWTRLSFKVEVRGKKYLIDITKEDAKVCRI